MEGKKSRPRAIFVFGAPCSGKTTFGESFAKHFNIGFFDLATLRSENDLSRKVILLILEQIAKTGQTVVLEGELGTEKERREIRRIFRAAGYLTSTIWLQTDIKTIRSRLKARYKSVAEAKTIYDSVIPKLEAPSEAESPIILSGKHTFDSQMKQVLAALSK